MTRRYAKISMVLSLAAFALLVTFNNLTDYGSNFAFVQHVLQMDTTFSGHKAMYRAVSTPWLWHAAYVLFIAGEGLSGLLLLFGAWHLWRVRHASGANFDAAKSLAIAGATTGFMVWFFGFMVVGGEWFLMWQSSTWNGQDAAFRFYAALLGVLVFVNQSDASVQR